jgi:hypothetical protein
VWVNPFNEEAYITATFAVALERPKLEALPVLLREEIEWALEQHYVILASSIRNYRLKHCVFTGPPGSYYQEGAPPFLSLDTDPQFRKNYLSRVASALTISWFQVTVRQGELHYATLPLPLKPVSDTDTTTISQPVQQESSPVDETAATAPAKADSEDEWEVAGAGARLVIDEGESEAETASSSSAESDCYIDCDLERGTDGVFPTVFGAHRTRSAEGEWRPPRFSRQPPKSHRPEPVFQRPDSCTYQQVQCRKAEEERRRRRQQQREALHQEEYLQLYVSEWDIV